VVGEFVDELPEEGFEAWEVYRLRVGTDVSLVGPVVVVIAEERIVVVLSAVVECILDPFGERLGRWNAKHADPNDLVAEITSPVPNHLDIAVVFHRQLMVIAPTK
jgi:hypothetical protein